MSNTEQFIIKATIIHNNSYDYSLVNYINNYSKVEIICKEHGIFLQSPKDHLYRKTGCPSCSKNKCDKTKTKLLDNFIHDAITIHKTKYDYSNVDYKNAHTKVQISCNKHGQFLQTPNSHLNGRGCKKCHNEYLSSIRCGIFTEEYFENNPTTKTIGAILYLIELKNKTQHLLKIGITTRSIQQRFEGLKTKSKYKGFDIIVIREKSLSLYQAHKIEQEILRLFEGVKEPSIIKFNGYTECFSFNEQTLQELIKCLMK